ncbi:hypothetical protein ATL41_1670 [Flavimobilis soli]|jgi:hypothetical protein|uniref:Uncharacterized protein n=1 Tax=Flavimobilis soli TaxID=442709 RepID=A0A2A9ECZ4_9MICO|nr:hypothetical protein ATL41_1670 [Flavimobilis soli]
MSFSHPRGIRGGAMPRFTKYEEKTDRAIPVVRLRRRG